MNDIGAKNIPSFKYFANSLFDITLGLMVPTFCLNWPKLNNTHQNYLSIRSFHAAANNFCSKFIIFKSNWQKSRYFYRYIRAEDI